MSVFRLFTSFFKNQWWRRWYDQLPVVWGERTRPQCIAPPPHCTPTPPVLVSFILILLHKEFNFLVQFSYTIVYLLLMMMIWVELNVRNDDSYHPTQLVWNWVIVVVVVLFIYCWILCMHNYIFYNFCGCMWVHYKDYSYFQMNVTAQLAYAFI